METPGQFSAEINNMVFSQSIAQPMGFQRLGREKTQLNQWLS